MAMAVLNSPTHLPPNILTQRKRPAHPLSHTPTEKKNMKKTLRAAAKQKKPLGSTRQGFQQAF